MVAGNYDGVPAYITAGNTVVISKRQLINQKFADLFGWWDDTALRTIYDLFDDASFDTSLWTHNGNGTLSESGGVLNLEVVNTAVTGNVSSDNSIPAGRAIFINGTADSSSQSSATLARSRVILNGSSSGTTSAIVSWSKESNGNGAGNDTNWAILLLPRGGNTYHLYLWVHSKNYTHTDGNSSYPIITPFSPTEITLVGDIDIEFEVVAGSGSPGYYANIQVEKVVYL